MCAREKEWNSFFGVAPQTKKKILFLKLHRPVLMGSGRGSGYASLGMTVKFLFPQKAKLEIMTNVGF